MAMGPSADSPDAYVDALSGWQYERVAMLRAAIHRAASFTESIKWTNLLFASGGPCIVIRAEADRVVLAFFRGKRLTHLDPQIRPGGKYELANLFLTEATEIDPARIEHLAAEAFRLNAELGDPTART